MKIEHIKKVISNYENKLAKVDVWSKIRKEKYTKKISYYKNKLNEVFENVEKQVPIVSIEGGNQEE